MKPGPVTVNEGPQNMSQISQMVVVFNYDLKMLFLDVNPADTNTDQATINQTHHCKSTQKKVVHKE